MKVQSKTKQALIQEIASLRQQISELERSELEHQQAEAEHRKAEKELQESEKKFRDIALSSGDWVWEVDSKGRYTYCSGRVQDILGYTVEEMLGKTPFEFMPADEAARIRDIFGGISSRRESILDLKNRNIHKNGGEVTLLTRGVPVLDADGNLMGYRGIDTDVTMHRRTEEALKRSEEYFRAITENSTDIILVVNEKGMTTYASPSVEHILGYKPEELIGKRSLDLITLDDVPRAIHDFGKAIYTRGVLVPNVFRVRHKGGSELVLEGVGKNLFENPSVAGFVMNVRDVTHSKEAEEELRESEERYRDMIENSSDLIQSVDLDGRFIFVNSAWRESLEYAEEELHDLSLFQIIHPDSMAHCQKMFQRIMSGHSVKHTQATFVSKSGKPVIVEGNVTPRMIAGQVIATHGFFRDITERKRAEKELEDSRNMLIRSEKLAAVGQLSAGVAHEILNPINIMSMRLQLLRMNESLPEKIKETISICEEQINRIIKISRDLQQFARVSERKITLSNINEMIDQVFSLMKPRLKVEGVKVDTWYQEALPLVPLDRDRMGQVILNLINNALDAMKDRPERLLRVVTELADKGVRLSFSDTGHGIPEEILSRIFDPFFTTKESGKGTGLGLSISYGIIQDHGGKIWAENGEWGGASFFIELPLGESAVP